MLSTAGVERVPQDARGAAAEHDLRAGDDRGGRRCCRRSSTAAIASTSTRPTVEQLAARRCAASPTQEGIEIGPDARRADRPPRHRLVPRRARHARAARHLQRQRRSRSTTCWRCSASPTRSCCSARSTRSPRATPRAALLAAARLAETGRDLAGCCATSRSTRASCSSCRRSARCPPSCAITPERDARLAEQAARVPPADVVRLLDLLAEALRAIEGRRRRAHAARARAGQGREPRGRPVARGAASRGSSGSRQALRRRAPRAPSTPPTPRRPPRAGARTGAAAARRAPAPAPAAGAASRAGTRAVARRRRAPAGGLDARPSRPSSGPPSSTPSAPTTTCSPTCLDRGAPGRLRRARADVIAFPADDTFRRRKAEPADARARSSPRRCAASPASRRAQLRAARRRAAAAEAPPADPEARARRAPHGRVRRRGDPRPTPTHGRRRLMPQPPNMQQDAQAGPEDAAGHAPPRSSSRTRPSRPRPAAAWSRSVVSGDLERQGDHDRPRGGRPRGRRAAAGHGARRRQRGACARRRSSPPASWAGSTGGLDLGGLGLPGL